MATSQGQGVADRQMRTRLPDPPANVPQEVRDWMAAVIRAVATSEEQRLQPLVRGYTITNAPAVVRSLDYSTATLDDLLGFMCTLVQDLQKAGAVR